MLVLKFGGTSLAGAERIRHAATIVRARLDRKPLVVVSAMAGITDRLVALAAGPDTSGTRDELQRSHREVIEELGLEPDLLDGDFEELAEAIRAPIAPERRDRILSFGERLCSKLLAGHLTASGTTAVAVRADRVGLLTDGRFGRATPLEEAYAELRRHVDANSATVVLTGFIGVDRAGRTTTLGRGGSDFTAAIVGRAMSAEEIQIWTDVDGVMTANPHVVPSARPIEVLSFAEASELAYYGAKVIHPSTMIPAVRANIPIRVQNTSHPERAGTLILEKCGSSGVLKSIASKSGIILIHISSTRMLLHHGFLARIFEVFGRHEVVIDMIATSEVSVSVTTDSDEGLAAAVEELKEIAEVRVERDQAIVCLVGEGIREAWSAAGQVFSAVGEARIGTRMISMGAAGINISFLVDGGDVERAVQALHGAYFEREKLT